MADSDYHRGEMDIHEHEVTFRGFLRLSKWGSLIVVAGVLFFSMWLAAGTGLIAASIATVVLLAAGIFFLRDKPRPADAH
jgi:uncharacterized membrane protein YGL010W